MAEAGLALAGISLAFQVFSGCVQAFTLLQGAQNLGKDASAIQCLLAWAEYKLVSPLCGHYFVKYDFLCRLSMHS